MKQRSRTALHLTLGLVVVGGGTWLAFLVIRSTARFMTGIDTDLAKAIVAAAATLIASVVALAGSKAYEARSNIRRELRERKTPVYEDIVKTLFQAMFAGTIFNKQIPEKELKRFFAVTTERLTIWGSDDLLLAWGDFKTRMARNPENPTFLLEDLLLAIRKDLGHRNRGLERGSILRLFITDVGEHLAKDALAH